MVQLEGSNDDQDLNSRLNTVVDLDQCRTICTTWDEEEEIEYGIHIALSSIRQLNPIAVGTETKKSFNSNGELVEETEIVSLGELFLVPEESTEPDSEDVLEAYTKSDSTFVDSLEQIISSLNSHLRLVFNDQGFDSDYIEIDSYMTATYTLATEELINVIDPDQVLHRDEARQLLSEIATNEKIDSRMSAPAAHGNGNGQRKYAIERDLTMGFDKEADVVTPDVVLDTIDHIHNGVFNNKQTVALTHSIAKNTDLTQAKIAAVLGVDPSVISVQLQDANDEIERAQHTTEKCSTGDFV